MRQAIFIRSWWVWSFALICGLLYEKGVSNIDQEFRKLSIHLASLEVEKTKALLDQKQLQRQINSQSDLAWLELTLMKGLGVCPEGQQKVFFYSDKENLP